MAGANAQSYNTPITAYNNTGLTNNLGATTVYAIPAGLSGVYRVQLWIRVTTAATSSTLPNVDLVYTSGGVAITTGTSTGTSHIIATNTGNTTTTSGFASVCIQCDASTNLQVVTANYASNSANVMTYEVRVRVEYLG